MFQRPLVIKVVDNDHAVLSIRTNDNRVDEYNLSFAEVQWIHDTRKEEAGLVHLYFSVSPLKREIYSVALADYNVMRSEYEAQCELLGT